MSGRRALAVLALLASLETSGRAFPVTVSANGRYLQDQNGTPYPILGRAAWYVISVSTGDQAAFLDDTAARGFNAIEMKAMGHDPRANNPPRNGNGDLPFTKRLDGGTWTGALTYGNADVEAPDFTAPNEAYWSYLDGLVAAAESRGLLVFLFPAYVGYAGGEQGWMREMVANGTARMRQYGAFVAGRYRNQKNIVWMMGGDMGTGGSPFSSAQTAVERALIDGLKSVAGQSSTMFSAEWDSNSICTDQTTFAGHCTLQGAYSWTGQVNTYGRNAYSHAPAMPSFLMEEPYDEEGPDGNAVNPNATQPVRRFLWSGWLSTIGGYIAGNGYIWPFKSGWQSHLDTPGARDTARLNAFIKSVAWHELVPSELGGTRKLVVSGGGSVGGADHVAAAATPSGAMLVAYLPPTGSSSRKLTVDMRMLGGPARARWFNPTTGAYTDIAAAIPNTGTNEFTTPGGNDWVLVLEAGAFTGDAGPPPAAAASSGCNCGHASGDGWPVALLLLGVSVGLRRAAASTRASRGRARAGKTTAPDCGPPRRRRPRE